MVINFINTDLSRIIVGISMISVVAFVEFLNRRGHSSTAGHLLIAYLWIIYSIVYLLGPVSSIFLASYVIVFMYAMILFGLQYLVAYVFLSFIMVFSNFLVLRPYLRIEEMFHYSPGYSFFLLVVLTYVTLLPLSTWYKELNKEINHQISISAAKEAQRIKYEHIFLNSPVGYLECVFDDFIAFVNEMVDQDQNYTLSGGQELTRYLMRTIEISSMNARAKEIFGVKGSEEYFLDMFFPEESLARWREILVQIWTGVTSLSETIIGMSLASEEIHLLMHLEIVSLPNSIEKFGILAIEDISSLKEIEHRLLDSNEEKSILLKEMHHRVKNNLQIIMAILDMMITRNYTRDEIVKTANERMMALSLVHTNLYQSSEQLSQISMKSYLENLVHSLVQSSRNPLQNILVATEFHDHSIPIDRAVPLGLIITEVFTNALKHAFPDHSGTVQISSREIGRRTTYAISDNGTGFSSSEEEDSLGFNLIRSLAGQLSAELEITSNSGTTVEITIDS